MKNKILVQICDKEYSLITEEPEDYVKTLAGEITSMIEETAYKNLRTSRYDATMITCLDLCDKIHKLSEDNDNMRREIVGYVDEIGRLSKKLASLERQKPGRNPGARAANEQESEKIDEAEDNNVTEHTDIPAENNDSGGESVKPQTPVYRKF